jgi:hypothetical protein
MISVTSCNTASAFPSQHSNEHKTYTRIIRLQNRNLDALILEEPLSLSQVQRSMIRRSVPSPKKKKVSLPIPATRNSKEDQAHQFVKKVILSQDMVALLQLVHPLCRH